MSCTITSQRDPEHIVEIQYLINNNDPSGFFILIKDLTEKQDLIHKMLQLGHLESIGLLAGCIAHDFNNLLIGILGNIVLARTSPGDPNALDRCLTKAENATLGARDLTKQLLTLSKGGAPDKSITVLGEDLMEAANFALHGSKIQCTWNLETNLWPVEVDVGQIGQVMQNLIINAEQANVNEGCITIACDNTDLIGESNLPDGPYIKITVKDEGYGIPEEHRNHIFDPYFTTKENGSGLGLATSHAIIKQHNGMMYVHSVSDEGTTFTILLPESNKPAPPVQTVEPENLPPSGTGKILMLDDETVIQDLIGRMLNNAGYEVDFADHGKAAIETYKAAVERQEPFDVVIMDLTIPGGMGGKDAIHELLIYDPDIKGIVSSGYPNDPVMVNFNPMALKTVSLNRINLRNFIKPFKMSSREITIKGQCKKHLMIAADFPDMFKLPGYRPGFMRFRPE